MNRCIKCGCSPFEKVLHRTEPFGSDNGGWMCMGCIEKHEPELGYNLKSESDFKVVKDIAQSMGTNI